MWLRSESLWCAVFLKLVDPKYLPVLYCRKNIVLYLTDIRNHLPHPVRLSLFVTVLEAFHNSCFQQIKYLEKKANHTWKNKVTLHTVYWSLHAFVDINKTYTVNLKHDGPEFFMLTRSLTWPSNLWILESERDRARTKGARILEVSNWLP